MYIPCTYAVWPSNPRETLVLLPGFNLDSASSLFVNSSIVKPSKGTRGFLEASLLGFSDDSLLISVRDSSSLEKDLFLIRFEDLLQ
jgi:hypothetical protein